MRFSGIAAVEHRSGRSLAADGMWERKEAKRKTGRAIDVGWASRSCGGGGGEQSVWRRDMVGEDLLSLPIQTRGGTASSGGWLGG